MAGMIDIDRFASDGIGKAPFAIKSMQQVRVSTVSGSVNTTITEVIVENTAVLMFTEGLKNVYPTQTVSDCYLSSTTNLRVTANHSATYLNVLIIEFRDGTVKSYQTGAFDTVGGSSTQDTTISAVVIAKSLVICNGSNGGEVNGYGYLNRPTGRLTTPTNLNISATDSYYGYTAGRWIVIEFY